MTSAKILIGEDEILLAKELEKALQRAGYQVVGRVTSGEEVLRTAAETQPDLILMDIKLKGKIDGIEAAEAIRSRMETAIVYLTAHTASDVFERAKTTQPYAYLSKPVSIQELGRTVEMALYKSQLDRRLKESEERYRHLFENMSNAVAIYKPVGGGEDFVFTGFNKAAEAIEGVKREEILGKSFRDLFPGIRESGFLEVFQRVWRTGEPEQYTLEDYKHNLISGWRELTLYKMPSSDIVVIYDDVTELKRYSEILEAQNQAHKDFLDEVDQHRLFHGLLKSILHLTGSEYGYIGEVLRTEEGGVYQLSRAISNLAWTPQLQSYYEENWRNGLRFEASDTLQGRVIKTGRPIISNDVENDPRSKGLPEGHPPIVSFMGLPIYKGKTLVGTLGVANRPGGYHEEIADYLEPYISTCSSIIAAFKSDLDRKRFQSALRDSEQRFRNAFQFAASGMALIGLDGRFLQVNESLCQMLGYTPPELSTMTFQEVTHPDDLAAGQNMFDEMMQGRKEHGQFEKRYIHKDGRVIWAHLSTCVVRDRDGKPLNLISQVQDITGHKKAEGEHLRLMTAIEQAAETIVITDQHGTIKYVNPSFELVTGFAREEAIGRNPRILRSGEHDEQFYHEMWETLTRGDIWRGHLVNMRKDGTLFQEEATISPVRDESGNTVNYVAVKRDVTAQVLLEKQLRQAQKMESIGTLAAGISHDFNNLLQIVLGYCDMMIMGKRKSSPDVEHLESIRKAAKDGGELVKGLLTFSRQVESKLRPTDLNLELKRIRNVLRRTIPRMIEIRFAPGRELKPVSADPVQIEQVLLNVCVNAHHAMPTGGTLTIETGNVTLDEDYCRNRLDVEPGEYVQVQIADTGHGMEQEVLEHIFEPFYTTKKAGEGTGLGLAVVYGIVKNHGGHILCDSEPHKGTTFRICLPAIVRQADRHSVVGARGISAYGTETILLVDDEEKIRNIVSQTMTLSGYTVLTASNGSQALDIYRERKDHIDLIVLDLVMPEMGGMQCLEEILRIDPTAQVLVASGYWVHGPTRDLLDRQAAGFISKPFEMGEFLRVVRNTLDRSGAPESPAHDSAGCVGPRDEGGAIASDILQAPLTLEIPLRLRILAIDDREPYLKMLEAGLAQFDQTTFTASSAVEGLRVFGESEVDLVICDLGMPDLDGWEVGRRIKEVCREKAIQKPPFILLTGQAEKEEIDQQDREKLTNSGVDAIVGKPIDIPDLLEVAGKLLRRVAEDSRS